MPGNGIMKEIQSLLAQDKSTAEVIALGFRPSTVYKVQRLVRKQNGESEQPPPQSLAEVLVTNADPHAGPEPKDETGNPNQQSGSLEGQAAETDSLRKELTETLDRIAELEVEAAEVQALRERVAELEPESLSAAEWQRKHHDLEDQLGHTAGQMDQEVRDWQGKFEAEQKARLHAESLADQYGAEAASLKEADQALRRRLESLPGHLAQEVWELVQPLNSELEELRPLKIWAGHSCSLQ